MVQRVILYIIYWQIMVTWQSSREDDHLYNGANKIDIVSK